MSHLVFGRSRCEQLATLQEPASVLEHSAVKKWALDRAGYVWRF